MGGDMLIYWLMFAFPSAMALVEQSDERHRQRFGFAWIFAMLGLILLIGFRWETGGDWGNYSRMVEQALWYPTHFSPLGDPGFTLLITYAAHTSLGLLLITAASGVLMGIALTRFCIHQPRPWLCLAVAVPYLVVVMGMGYIRQGMAISFLLMGLVSLKEGRTLRYCAWVCCGALFHSTVLILLPLGVMVMTRNILLQGLLGLASLALLARAILLAHADTYVVNYIDSEMSSSGAMVRLAMTALPAAIFLAFPGRFELNDRERSVWKGLSLAAIVAFVALFFSPSSTVIDRLGLYLIPVQCFVYCRLPDAFAGNRRMKSLVTVAVILGYALAFFVWLTFAVNVEYWLPYRSYFFEDGICLEC
jgi:hypothetical protein